MTVEELIAELERLPAEAQARWGREEFVTGESEPWTEFFLFVAQELELLAPEDG